MSAAATKPPRNKNPLTRFRKARLRSAFGDKSANEDMFKAARDALTTCARTGKLPREIAHQLNVWLPRWNQLRAAWKHDSPARSFDGTAMTVSIPPKIMLAGYYVALARAGKINDKNPDDTVISWLNIDERTWKRYRQQYGMRNLDAEMMRDERAAAMADQTAALVLGTWPEAPAEPATGMTRNRPKPVITN